MEQFEKVLKPTEGMYYILCDGKNGEQILKLVSNKPRYFTKIISKDREKVERWLKDQRGSTQGERKFLFEVRMALISINYDYWIATMEPTVIDERINYSKGTIVGEKFSVAEWKRLANEYAPELGSRLAKQSELFLWYALRIVNKLWTLDYVANDSSSGGNYKDAPETYRRKERAGARLCGGYFDGQGNTRKLVEKRIITYSVELCHTKFLAKIMNLL